MEPLTFDRLWSCLVKQCRQDAALAFLRSDDPVVTEERDSVLVCLAAALNFREKTVRSMPGKRLAPLLAGKATTRLLTQYQHLLIRAWLLVKHRDVIVEFLDALRIPHANGMISEEFPDIEPDRLAAATAQLLSRADPKPAAVYLAYCLLTDEQHGTLPFGNLREAIESSEVDFAALLSEGHARTEPAGVQVDSDDERPEASKADSVTPVQASEGFTTLDRQVIREIVSSVQGETGALSSEQLIDMVEEIVDLNSSRHKSLFHRGFLHAVFDIETNFHFPGENESRRMWYLTGVIFGHLRRDNAAGCLGALRENTELARSMAVSSQCPCGRILLPHIVDLLVDNEELALLGPWVRRQTQECPDYDQAHVVAVLKIHGELFVKIGNYENAAKVLELLDHLVETLAGMPDDYREDLKADVQRSTAGILREKGSFGPAKEKLKELFGHSDPGVSSQALADCGLVDAGLRSLRSAIPCGTPDHDRAVVLALSGGRSRFEEAVSRSTEISPTPHYCLGVIALFGEFADAGRAAGHFARAVAVLHSSADAHRDEEILYSARLLHGIALLEMLEPKSLKLAHDRLHCCLEADDLLTPALWVRALHAASVFDDKSTGEMIMGRLVEKKGNDALRLIGETGLYRKVPALRRRYLEWLARPELQILDRWDEVRGVLDAALAGEDTELAGDALDLLEVMAAEHPDLQLKYIDMLQDSSAYSPAWEYVDAESALIRSFQDCGRHAEAADLLKRRFHRLRSQGDSAEQATLSHIVEQISFSCPTDSDLDELTRLVEATGDAVQPTQASSAIEAKILYVGGNETQAAYESRLRNAMAEKYPGVSLEFVFPGWSSNWQVHKEEVKRRKTEFDAIVLNSLVRTQLGRSIRKMCDKSCPWIPCTGRGRQSLQSSIETAVAVLSKNS